MLSELDWDPRFDSRNIGVAVNNGVGVLRLIAWRYVVVEDPAVGVTGILCSGDDVTDARRAEEEAREHDACVASGDYGRNGGGDFA